MTIVSTFVRILFLLFESIYPFNMLQKQYHQNSLQNNHSHNDQSMYHNIHLYNCQSSYLHNHLYRWNYTHYYSQ